MQSKPLTLGSAIAERRNALGLSLKDLARLVHKEDGHTVSGQYLHDIERGARTPSSPVLGEIAKALGTDISYLQVLAGRVPNAISDYFQEHPETASAVAQLFARAREAGFTAWDEVDVLPTPKRAAR